jgi:hypothetical protein
VRVRFPLPAPLSFITIYGLHRKGPRSEQGPFVPISGKMSFELVWARLGSILAACYQVQLSVHALL